MSHRMDEIKPEHYITEQQCQEMIDKAIDKHNKTATIISAILGAILSGILLSWSPVISRSCLNLKIYKEEPLRGATYENT